MAQVLKIEWWNTRYLKKKKSLLDGTMQTGQKDHKYGTIIIEFLWEVLTDYKRVSTRWNKLHE